jgi:spore maturation protein CgeB
MLKVLYLPLNDQGSVQQATYDAWNNVGVKLEIYDFNKVWSTSRNKAAVNDGFLKAVRAFQPKLIHMQLQFSGLLSVEVLNEARRLSPGVVITNWTGDCRAYADSGFCKISHGCDYSLISSTGQLDMYKNGGCKNVHYWQIGYDPKLYFPKNYTSFKYDISFTANHYGNFPASSLRGQAAHTLYNKYKERFGLFGRGYNIPNARFIAMPQTNEVYNSSTTVLSISHFNDVSHYFSDRLLMCLASGRPVISWNFPNYDSYFVDGQDLFIANSIDDIVSIVQYCKNNPDKAKEVGKNGHRKVLIEHTYTSKILELINMVNLSHLL